MRSKLTDPDTGRISLPAELAAGAAAGACQVSVTNPLEIVKIRLQMVSSGLKKGHERITDRNRLERSPDLKALQPVKASSALSGVWVSSACTRAPLLALPEMCHS